MTAPSTSIPRLDALPGRLRTSLAAAATRFARTMLLGAHEAAIGIDTTADKVTLTVEFRGRRSPMPRRHHVIARPHRPVIAPRELRAASTPALPDTAATAFRTAMEAAFREAVSS